MALDKLNEIACDERFSEIKFISICCDDLDGAREIIEHDDELKWQHISHYFMDFESKEEAKKLLGFSSVPFYVFVDEHGIVSQKGGPADVDFYSFLNPSHNSNLQEDTTRNMATSNNGHVKISNERVFEIDEDF